jgi:formate hydrogenlyase subunit 3/multisubunit Na+/H+ antiporter MnhD subunit
MDSPPAGKLKRVLLVFLQAIAMGVFVAVAVNGVMTYWGGETNEKIPPDISLLMGLLAVICVGVIIYIGGIQDRIAQRDDDIEAQQDNRERENQ